MFEQTMKLTALSLSSLGARVGTSSIIVVGIGGVVAVLVGLLAMARGFEAALEETGRPERALVLRTGASDEITSWLAMEELSLVLDLDGIVTASGELFVVVDLVTRDTGKPGVAIARGVGDAAFTIRPELQIVAGRRFASGRNEIIAGSGAVAGYSGLDIGDEISIRDNVYIVVGHFQGAGALDSEIWLDLPAAQAAFRRQGTVSSVRVGLDRPAEDSSIAFRIAHDPRLNATLVPETRYYRAQSQERSRLIESFAYLVTGIMAIGSVIAAYSTMHTAVSARAVEIATLRALGFRSAPIVASVLLEAMTLALAGGLIASGIVYVLYDGYTASTLDVTSMSHVAFQFAVTPELVMSGLGAALLLGLLGALVPALGTVRGSIAQAQRAD